jgi:hypothetical protein
LTGGRANWPRSWFVAASLAFAPALAAMSGPTGATDTAATAAEKDARFFLAVCQNALDDLAAVSRLAAEHNWKSMVDPRFPESKPEWVDGMWRVNRDDRSYTVGTGSAPKGIKYCSVAFGEPRASRDDFVVIVAESLRLTALDDTGASDLRFARYRVENLSREGPTLQVVVFHGGLSQAMILDPIREPPPLRPK